MCKQSLLIVSSCYIRVQTMMIAIEEFRFQGRVETHIIWDAPAFVTASCSGTTCDICVHWETATFNSKRYLGLMTSGVSRDAFRELGQKTIESMTRPDAKWRRPTLQ